MVGKQLLVNVSFGNGILGYSFGKPIYNSEDIRCFYGFDGILDENKQLNAVVLGEVI